MRVNFEIKAPMVRVIDDEGKMLGVFQVPDAVRMAYDKGLDLIEIAAEANPPTCKMMDFGKYKYQLKKKAAESKKKQTVITVKEIQLRPNTDEHDIDFKTRHIQEFLKEGDKVRVIVTFRGREVTHAEIGRALLSDIVKTLGDSCVIEQAPLMEGKKMSMLLGPSAGKPASKAVKPIATSQAAKTGAPAAGQSNSGGQAAQQTNAQQSAGAATGTTGEVKK
jgi:translation initiation factor IF-3